MLCANKSACFSFMLSCLIYSGIPPKCIKFAKISFFDKLDDERQYVLVDMAFNLGLGGLLKFQKMLSFIGSGNYRQAATEMLSSSYARQVKLRAERLAQTLHSGKWHL